MKFSLITLIFGGIIREVYVKNDKYLYFIRSKMSLIVKLFYTIEKEKILPINLIQ